MNKTFFALFCRHYPLFLFMLVFFLVFTYACVVYSIDNPSRFSPKYTFLETITHAKSDLKMLIPGDFKTAYETILENPNEFALKYINLPYEYSFGSNSIPLAVSGYIGNGDILELGIVRTTQFFI